MKRLAFLLVLAVFSAACSGTGKGNIVLEVDVVDQASKEVVLIYHDQILTAELDNEGHAEFVIDDHDAVYARVCHYPRVDQMMNVYLERGDRAAVRFSGNDFKGTFAFEGEKEPAVKYLNTVVLTALPDEDYADLKNFQRRLNNSTAGAPLGEGTGVIPSYIAMLLTGTSTSVYDDNVEKIGEQFKKLRCTKQYRSPDNQRESNKHQG